MNSTKENNMKQILTAGFLLIALGQVRAEGITFSKENWKQLVQQAKTTNKIMFVDFYATWCGPCKQLEKEVFTNAEVGNYFNEHFISKRIDAESEELELVKQMNIEAYPTLVFFDVNGEILYKVEGAPDAAGIVNYAKQASAVFDMKRNNSWKNDIESLKSYLEALATHQPAAAEKIVVEYLRSLPKDDIRKEENWSLLNDYIKDVNNPSWQYVLNNLDYFSKSYDGLATSIERLATEIMQKAVASKNRGLLTSKNNLDIIVSRLLGDSTTSKDQYTLWNSVVYLEKVEDKVGYANAINTFISKYYWSEAKPLTYYASKILSAAYSVTANANAIKWAERALILDKDNYLTHWVLSIGYSKANNIPKSNLALQNFLRLSKADLQLSEKFNLLMYSY